ncbi:alpha/beta hydrolase [Lactovum miscens]|uniref:Putative alpha/beta hydrolase family protein n=1 Tax=Lactovum miscens TaxID=190387 RepID=A0A841C789_9LACT|nr:alpha/beta hydrolase [Lactovum miscens]MBB5888167.1 putative alpha/beta hydrolase family protein [Lactovum miscens]
MEKRIIKIIYIGIILVLFGVVFFIVVFSPSHLRANDLKKSTKTSSASETMSFGSKKEGAVPTIYISGSGGNVSPMNSLLGGIFPNIDTKNDCLTIQVNISDHNKLTVSGNINPDDKSPIIEFATVKGTENGELYSAAIKVAMRYLVTHYNYTEINIVGFSSGGTGAVYYMIDNENNKSFPKVDKFISLDGEYNSEGQLQFGESLQSVIANGPILKTPMYRYIAKNYRKINSSTEIYFMEGNWNFSKQTDGAVSWADTFSIYHLLVENKNVVSMYLYPTKYSHGNIPKEPLVQNYIKKIIY